MMSFGTAIAEGGRQTTLWDFLFPPPNHCCLLPQISHIVVSTTANLSHWPAKKSNVDTNPEVQ